MLFIHKLLIEHQRSSKYPIRSSTPIRVEAPATDHLRDDVSYLKKYKAVQIFLV